MRIASRIERLTAKAARISDDSKENRRLLVKVFKQNHDKKLRVIGTLARDASLQRSVKEFSSDKIRRIYLADRRTKSVAD